MAGAEKRCSGLSDTSSSSADAECGPRESFGLLSIQDSSSSWAKDVPQLCHPPDRVPAQGGWKK